MELTLKQQAAIAFEAALIQAAFESSKGVPAITAACELQVALEIIPVKAWAMAEQFVQAEPRAEGSTDEPKCVNCGTSIGHHRDDTRQCPSHDPLVGPSWAFTTFTLPQR